MLSAGTLLNKESGRDLIKFDDKYRLFSLSRPFSRPVGIFLIWLLDKSKASSLANAEKSFS
ncbi:hypothetical protein BpHYR1_019655 [Brachionus plicatilis]|uniref:Uncharacterized protein n=1 Tax=Brachionus plicatilis TaxID=10195 RepID=A0A3M7Q7G4_BRAPC|nr:hypothetical protein BpHYR1_019655 [Brachionus plicatilis]